MYDKEQLLEGRCLSANHIAAGQNLLKSAYPKQHGLQDTCCLSSNKWLDVPEQFVQVIFVEPNHWACLTNKFTSSTCDSCTQAVNLYDSLHTRPNEQGSIVKQACTILKSQQSTIAVNVINVQIQDGASDCALFALAMATDLCRDIDPIYVTYHQDKMRQHLAKSFEQLALSPFPSDINSSSEKCRVIHTKMVEIYCIYRQPEFVPMIECDSCSVWYHAECVDLTGDVLEEDEDIPWFCSTCECMYNISYPTCRF